ncbi:polysaccharide pyruvyl transferase-domain-containing protein [Leucosporidium creatinivorum]|uniref:Polysaccharide pyruvyl transferase-domain-containing protein n=1 Tax=Leucosporidium creatinivorum TaxID=106004 RepID=A0A1Y2FWT9_9BASI|nr:polysaccharide pyruvyl transferase-domain-containing protein [Leucosporidium creatinivorum]
MALTGERRKGLYLGAAVLALFILFSLRTSTSETSSNSSSSSPISYSTQLSLSNATRDACHKVMEHQKNELFSIFSSQFKGVRNIALISMPDHHNKGDSVIFTAEMMLLASLGINIHYQCGVRDFEMSALQETVDKWGEDHFAIVFHGGGNFGDLYEGEHGLKLHVMRNFPSVRTHIFPQSLKFRHEDKIAETRSVLASLTHPLNSIAVRDIQSRDFAQKHFNLPNFRIDLTPDIVFYMGFRPELREQLAPTTPNDFLFFRRKDVEGSNWDFAGFAGSADFPKPFVQRIAEKVGVKSLSVETGDWIDTDLDEEERTGGHIQFRAWRRFMQGAEWLSSADFIVLDRLHGHIVSLVLGIPHVLIDNSIGKLSDYHSTWTKDCPLGTLVSSEGGDEEQAAAVEGVYKKWVDEGKINGRNFVW